MEEINYFLIILATFIAVASPGPATLAIAGASMNQGRLYGLVLALGVLTGSFFWSFSTAFGLGVLMYANAWLFEAFRYFGACYLLYLSYKSLRSALSVNRSELLDSPSLAFKSVYFRGLLIHLSNPKAILFFGSLYSLGLPDEVITTDLLRVIATVGLTSTCVFIGYALLFSVSKVRYLYFQLRRVFESVFAVFFGVAGLKILANKLGD